MSAKILDGRSISKSMLSEVKEQAGAFQETWGLPPTLALVRGGDDPASVSYAGMIERTCNGCGIAFQSHTRPADTTQAEMVALVEQLSADKTVHGIIIQRPLPAGVEPLPLIDVLNPLKDIDGAHPINAGRLAQFTFVDRPIDVGPYLVPATPLGGLELLKSYDVEIAGKHAVIVGASNLIGKPLAFLLIQNWATVTVCDMKTKPLSDYTQQADIIASVTGVAHLIKADMVKPGATVLDFGFAKLGEKWVGDADFEPISEIAGAINPVPGGTGPMTNAMLMRNMITAAKWQAGE
ncbi:MAG: bifunctional 5,10-methylenetetrahydrofolate dehydrogenase/5,10-methenyltetrahydrofolate cyclohydrolase [Anaerolineae bacterium]|nr:bifunctional 5,10-methylenetetrahydrofolate dehydrogenase/5,10-methenyltetrahydrofolate cyclohydrolase [Anaerolineae bacterium]